MVLDYNELIEILDLDTKYFWTINGDGHVEIREWGQPYREKIITDYETLCDVIDNIDVDDPSEWMKFMW